jgi:OTU-like cysteine protease
MIWDFTCPDTLAPSHISSTSITAGMAAETAEKLKFNKYSDLSSKFDIVPIAIETFCSWGDSGKKFITILGSRMAAVSGDPRSTLFLRQRVSIAIQRGNALSVLGTHRHIGVKNESHHYVGLDKNDDQDYSRVEEDKDNTEMNDICSEPELHNSDCNLACDDACVSVDTFGATTDFTNCCNSNKLSESVHKMITAERKKCEDKSNDSLSAVFNAIKVSSSICQSDIQLRNDAVDKQLSDKHLRPVDVTGDGNCFFRAISVSIFGNQLQHDVLRQCTARHMSVNGIKIFKKANITSADKESVLKSAHAINANGIWVGEDAILAAADYLKRDIHVFIAAVRASPLIYSPLTTASDLSPIKVAFYEPGHYRAVLPISQSSSTSNNLSVIGDFDVFNGNMTHNVDQPGNCISPVRTFSKLRT